VGVIGRELRRSHACNNLIIFVSLNIATYNLKMNKDKDKKVNKKGKSKDTFRQELT